MIDDKKRWVYYYKNFLKPYPDDAPYTEMKDILAELSNRFEDGECVKLIENNTAAIRITDMAIDTAREVATILYQYSDTKISDPAFVNLETGALRVEEKLDGEGVAISAHMVVSLKPDQPRGATYLTLIEDVPGIGKTKIDPFLTSQFKAVFDKRYINYEGRKLKYRPTSELTGFASESLKDGLSKGYLAGFELKRYRNIGGGLDDEDYVKVDSFIVKLKVERRFSGDEAVSLINKINKKAKESDYAEMVVKYKRKEGKSASVPISTAREDAGDALFSKFEIVKVTNPLPQCVQEIQEEIAEKMRLLLIAARS